MHGTAETANVSPCALPAVAERARAVDGGGAVGAAAGPGAVVQMVGAGRRVLDLGEGRDEIGEMEDVLAELGGEGEEAEG